jgi:transposase
MINGILFVLRTGIPWRDLPKEFGKWQTVYKRFRLWIDQGLWSRIVSKIIDRLLAYGAIDFELWCVDGTVIRAHRAASVARKDGRTPEENAEKHALGRSRGGYSTKLHILTDGQGIPLAVTATGGQCHEAPEFENVLKSSAISIFRLATRPEAIAGDKAYSSATIREYISKRGISPVIPTRSNESSRNDFDQDLYKARNVIERLIG